MYFQGILALKYNGRKRKKFSINDYYRNNNFNEFIKEYPVILATTHSISKSKNQNYKFDYIIVDEASQVELVLGIIALNAAKNVVIVGDLIHYMQYYQDNSIICESKVRSIFDLLYLNYSDKLKEMQKSKKLGEINPYNKH